MRSVPLYSSRLELPSNTCGGHVGNGVLDEEANVERSDTQEFSNTEIYEDTCEQPCFKSRRNAGVNNARVAVDNTCAGHQLLLHEVRKDIPPTMWRLEMRMSRSFRTHVAQGCCGTRASSAAPNARA